MKLIPEIRGSRVVPHTGTMQARWGDRVLLYEVDSGVAGRDGEGKGMVRRDGMCCFTVWERCFLLVLALVSLFFCVSIR